MSSLKYSCYEGVGARNRKQYHYSQAVRIPAGADTVRCAGQGGWNPKDGSYSADVGAQIAQAFENVKINLEDAGVEGGWSQVYSVRSYHVPLDDESLGLMVENLKKYCPDHAPIWTVLGVPALGEKEMLVEIDVIAYDGPHEK